MEVPVLLVEFEGVLADTAALRHAALGEALAADGIELTRDLLRHATGRSIEDAVRLIREAVGAPDDPTAVELARLRAERAFAARAGKGLALRPGARAALEKLSTCGRLALVTRAARREVEFVLTLAGLDAHFRPIITGDEVGATKPDTAPYLLAMSRVAQLFPGQVLRGLAIEDAVLGVRAAREAGLLTVIVGAVPPQDAMEADCWVEELADLTPERVRALMGQRTGGKR